jgi:hypothetical protein
VTDLTDFDGCGRKCRLTGKHTLVWGECEHASKPEPTVSLSKIFKDTDGYPSIGYDEYTVQRLADLIEPALRNVQVRLGPNALAMLQRGETVSLSGGEYADLAREAAYSVVHRNDPAYTSRLRLTEFQTCDICGAAYKVGVECSTCAFRAHMAAEMAAREQTPDGQTVAYRAPGLDVLYCIACRPADDRFMPVGSSDLPDGGICANCDMDVLIQAGQDEKAIIEYAREVGLVEPEKAPQIVAAARGLFARSGVDTPGCNCGYESMGPVHHLRSCTWLKTQDVPHPDQVNGDGR